ncbi:hypothetical protein CEXT_594851 [Caerostris extrusa]|uniref:Uncharacterized protein n=1 Tax=Caerostris extrusa TaxID=172846 RepID=A0AAV4MM57_CAEEX|nr:hypothetical protein CEXT_594851 [Caerostris extrusa]
MIVTEESVLDIDDCIWNDDIDGCGWNDDIDVCGWIDDTDVWCSWKVYSSMSGSSVVCIISEDIGLLVIFLMIAEVFKSRILKKEIKDYIMVKELRRNR